MSSGYSTPPRSTTTTLRLITRRPAKLLTSSELKRCFSPIDSQHRCIPIRKSDCLVPFERGLSMAMILRTLFDPIDEQTSVQSSTIDDSVVPMMSSEPTIPEAVMREKLKFLLAKK